MREPKSLVLPLHHPRIEPIVRMSPALATPVDRVRRGAGPQPSTASASFAQVGNGERQLFQFDRQVHSDRADAAR